MEVICQFLIQKKNWIGENSKNKNKKFPLLYQKKKMKTYLNKSVNRIVKSYEIRKKTKERVKIYVLWVKKN